MNEKRISVTHSQITDAEAERILNDTSASRRSIHEGAAEPKQVIDDLLNKSDIEVAGRVIGSLAAKRDPYALELQRAASSQTPSVAPKLPMLAQRDGRPQTPPAAPDARNPFRASSGRSNPRTGRQRR